MNSTAYSRPSKLPGGAGGSERRPRLMRGFAAKIEPKKLGVGLLAGCCLALLTYVSLAKLFAIYSPVFASTANTSGLLQNSPPSSSSVPETTDAIPAEATFVGRKNDDPAADPVDFPEEGPSMDGSQEPGLPEVVSRKEDDAEKAIAATSQPKPSEEDSAAAGAGEGTPPAKMTCDENGVDEGFPYARPAVCELSGDIRVSPKDKTMYLVNPSGAAAGFDENGEKRLRPYARKDEFLLPAVVEVTVKSVPSASGAPRCTKRHRVPAVVFSVAGYTDNFFHDNTDALIPLFLTTAHLKGEVQLLITNYKPWWVQKYTPVLRKLSNYDVINFDDEDGGAVHCFPDGYLGLYRDRDLIISPHPTRNPRNYTMVDYNKFLRGALELPREKPAVLGEEPGMRPRMLIISRSGTRRLLNLDEVSAAASELGFNVTVAEAGGRGRRAGVRGDGELRRRAAGGARGRADQPDLPPHQRRGAADRALGEHGLDGDKLLRAAGEGDAAPVRGVLRRGRGDEPQGQVPEGSRRVQGPQGAPHAGMGDARGHHHEAGRAGRS